LLAEGSQADGAAAFLTSSFSDVGNPSAGGIASFDLTGSAPTQSNTLATVTNNGQPVKLAIGPDGCVYATRGVGVWRITDTTGACTYAAARPSESLYLSPIGASPNPAQGSSQTFTVSFHYGTVPDGTPVLLSVSGANPQVLQANTSSNSASFTYTGAHQGVDTIIATATVGATNLTSNQSVVTWGPGSDVTFLTLNGSPTTGMPNTPVTVVANLTDVSVNPIAPLAGQTINFSIGGNGCGAATNANGNASCAITPSGTGVQLLSGNFAGASGYNASSASQPFNGVVQVPVVTPTPTPTSTETPTPTATATLTPTPTATLTAEGAVTVTGEASGGGKPGATVNLGSFSYEASDSKEQTVSSVSISVSRPAVFSSMTLVATVGGGQVGSVTLTSPIGSTAVFTFLPAVQLPAGSSLSFALSGVIAGESSGSLDLNDAVRLAGITSFGGSRGTGGGGLLILALSLIGCAILPMTPRQRLRASLVTLAILSRQLSPHATTPRAARRPRRPRPLLRSRWSRSARPKPVSR
jgi:hypothetical protein